MKHCIGRLSFLLVVVCSGAGATDISSNISSDTTWSVSGSPYNITKNDFEVEEAATLTIEAGVSVRITSQLVVYGTLVATGSSESPVIFDELNSGSGWGTFTLSRNNCSESHKSHSLSYVTISNFTGRLYIDRQSLTLANSTLNFNTTNRVPIHGYNNKGASCPGSDVNVSLTSNTITINSSGSSGSAIGAAIHLDGVTNTISNNTISATFTGQLGDASAVMYETTNTDAFSASLSNNTISLSTTHSSTLQTLGVYYKDADVSGAIQNNTITVTGYGNVYGVYLRTDSQTSANTVTVSNASDASGGSTYGLYHIFSGNSCEDLIVNNKVSVSTQADSRNIYGIYHYGGTVKGNRVAVYNPTSSGSANGVYQRYYQSCIENNTISLHANELTTRAVTSDVINALTTVTVKNNISVSENGSQSIGISNLGSGQVSSSYNMFFQFATNFQNVTEGSGELQSDPLFYDSDFHLGSNSPAIDAGDPDSSVGSEPAQNGSRINLGAYGGTASATTTISSNNAPSAVSLLSPDNEATGLSTESLALSWQPATDEDGDTLTYYVHVCGNEDFFGCSSVSVESGRTNHSSFAIASVLLVVLMSVGFSWRSRVVLTVFLVLLFACNRRDDGASDSTQTNLTYSPSGLSSATTYFWKVIVRDDDGAITRSETRQFSTE